MWNIHDGIHVLSLVIDVWFYWFILISEYPQIMDYVHASVQSSILRTSMNQGGVVDVVVLRCYSQVQTAEHIHGAWAVLWDSVLWTWIYGSWFRIMFSRFDVLCECCVFECCSPLFPFPQTLPCNLTVLVPSPVSARLVNEEHPCVKHALSSHVCSNYYGGEWWELIICKKSIDVFFFYVFFLWHTTLL